jgi:hypothetical protein
MNNINSQPANTPAFKGMSVSNIKRFIPQIQDSTAKSLSKIMDSQIPNDVLEVVDNTGKNIIHSKKIPSLNISIPTGNIKYNGSENPNERLGFLMDIMNKIQAGELYK